MFAHVNHRPEAPKLGVLLCINGTGIQNSWLRKNMFPGLDYPAINDHAAGIPPGFLINSPWTCRWMAISRVGRVTSTIEISKSYSGFRQTKLPRPILYLRATFFESLMSAEELPRSNSIVQRSSSQACFFSFQ